MQYVNWVLAHWSEIGMAIGALMQLFPKTIAGHVAEKKAKNVELNS